MKAAAAWKRKDQFDNRAAGTFDFGLRLLQFLAVENDQRAPVPGRNGQIRFEKSPVQILV
jgi:hypothetical protein